MAIKYLNITVTNKKATFLTRQGDIVCGNSDYRVRFTFDSEWDGHDAKVARFIWGGHFTDVEFSGNEVDVPVISGATEVKVGVYTEGDGPHTTTSATIPATPSVLCEGGTASLENDKRYLNEAREVLKQVEEAAENAGQTVADVAAELMTEAGIVQELGSSVTAVMSQKAVTNGLDSKADKIEERGPNLYNSTEATDGYYFNVSTGQMVETSGNCTSYVKLDGPGPYITKVDTELFGTTLGAKLPLFDRSKRYIGTATGTLTEGTGTQKPDAELLINIDLEGAYYVGFTARNKYKNTIMFVKGSEYPAKYIPYTEPHVRIPNLIVPKEAATEVLADIVQQRANLYDRDADGIQEGYIMSNGTIDTNSEYIISDRIPVKGGTTYLLTKSPTVSTGVLGGQYTEDGAYITNISGTLSNDGRYCTFTTAADQRLAYIRVNFDKATHPTGMLVEGTTYPSEYIPYGRTLTEGIFLNETQRGEVEKLTRGSVLYGKRLSVNGDSICAGAGHAGGYAGIIAVNNNMTVQNIGVGGGTITAETYASNGQARHWICRTIANMDANADFAIVEGGVNDSGGGVPLGAISNGYNATLDDTTFYGAFESMLKQLTLRFAGKKIGYIAVHQMTNNYRASNDEATSYYWAARKCCEKWGVPFLDLNTTVPPFAYFSNTSLQDLVTTYTHNGDGWHPNEEGYKKYYVPKIEAWLKTL